MPKNKPRQRLTVARLRIALLRGSLGEFDYVCSGNPRRRMPAYGNPTCRCKKDPALRHGPYYYWERRKGGRLVQMLLTPAEAEVVAQAIRNYKTIQRILRQCGEETVKIIRIRLST